MPSSTLSLSGEIGGAPLGATLQRTADGSIRQGPITLPAAEAGTLSTRSTDTTGTLTIPGTTLQTGDTIDVYWDGGRRYDVAVGTVVGDSVPISGGAGDILPVQDTAVTAAKQVSIVLAFTGDELVAIGAKLGERGHISIRDTGATALSIDLVKNETWFWLDGQQIANPFAGDSVDGLMASNASSSATAVLNLGVLYDSTP
ncbi:MAG: hypothetical protein KJZ69_19435 [Phycisphaerales bacterium]|nr:hypothetical protein [Phycisphaerales bacterium]